MRLIEIFYFGASYICPIGHISPISPIYNTHQKPSADSAEGKENNS